MNIDNNFINDLLKNANISEKLRFNSDLRNSASDTSLQMINALLPGTKVSTAPSLIRDCYLPLRISG